MSHTLCHTGSRLGAYEVLEEIGSGGLGVVYRARHVHLERLAAVKVLHPQWTRSPEFVERFRDEGRVMAMLEHPNLLRVYDAGETDGVFYLATRLLEGWTLEALMHRPVPRDAALVIVAQVAQALQYAHARGVIHRDVKPANIMISPDRTVTLMDLGVARLRDQPGLTQPGMRVGTPYYMSPEQILGRPADGRSDLYSLGVVLHQLLTGTLPFGGADTETVYAGHLRAEIPELGPEHPEWLRRVVRRALAKAPEERFPDAGAFLEALSSQREAGHPGAAASSVADPSATLLTAPPDAASSAPSPGETALVRHHRTALALDVVGSSKLKHPGRTMAIQQQFALFRRYVRELLDRHHRIDHVWAGDGLLALFARPSEGAACAAALLEGLERFNASGAWEPIRIRIGVASGPVAMQPGEPLGEVVSRTLDHAGHLQKRCPENTALIADSTWAGLPRQEDWALVREPYALEFPFGVYRYRPGAVMPDPPPLPVKPDVLRLRLELTVEERRTEREVRGEALLGRGGDGPAPDLEIRGDDAVSRRHLRLFAGAAGFYVEDLDSANGTRLNGIWLRPSAPAPLAPGDQVELGERTTLRVLEITSA